MLKKLNILTLLVAVFLMNANSVSAQQYGGITTTSGLMVEKQVRDPITGNYINNLGLSDNKYRAENTIFFKISVVNSGGATLDKVVVTDYLPNYVTYVSGGSYNASDRTVKFTFYNLSASERQSAYLQVKVVSLKKLPLAKTIICPLNKVVAKADSLEDSATSQFCIEKKAMVVNVPKAGDPTGLFMAFSAIPTLLAGFKLKKRS